MSMGPIYEKIVETFNTHLMKDSVIEALMTGRIPERDRILGVIEDNLQAGQRAVQHVIVYGPRGFGKSFLVRMVQIEAKKRAEQGAPLAFILLPEEQHNLIRSPSGLLDYAALKLEDLRNGTDRSWEESMFQWPNPKRMESDWQKAETKLDEELDRQFPDRKGLAVVVVENFDILLNATFKGKQEEQLLRRWMTRADLDFMLLATATGSVDLDYDRPLFHAFRPVRLQPWTQQDCLGYFNRRRDFGNRPSLSPEEESKARAVSDFIGGTPRLAQLLAEVLDAGPGFEQGEPLAVAAIMNALADRLADYYRRRIDDLPPLARGLLDALIRGGEPCSATELAQRVQADGQNTIARVMNDLQRADIIRGLPAPDSKEKLFRVVDRVFVHYYRLRQGHFQAIDSPLSTILEFLRAFYSHQERQHQALRYLEAGRPAEADLFARLAREGQRSSSDSGYRQNFSYRLSRYLQIAPKSWPGTTEDIAEDLDENQASVIHQGSKLSPAATPLEAAIRSAILAQAYIRMGLIDKAEEVLENSCRNTKGDPGATIVAAHEFAYFLDWEKADIAAAVKWAEIGGKQCRKNVAPILRIIAVIQAAWSLVFLGHHEEALAEAADAASLAMDAGEKRGQAVAMRYKAISLYKLRRYEEAIEAAEQAAMLAEVAGDKREQAIDMRCKAFSLYELRRYEEAIEAAEQAAMLAEEAGDKRGQAIDMRCKAISLNSLKRYEQAIDIANKAAALAAAAGDNREKTIADLVSAKALRATGRLDESFALAVAVFEQAFALNDLVIVSEAILELFETAKETPQTEIIPLFARFVEAVLHRHDADHAQPPFEITYKPDYFIPDLLAAVTRARAWEEFDGFLAQRDVWLMENLPWWRTYKFSNIGPAIARVGNEEGRAAGFDAAQGILSRMAKLIGAIPQEKIEEEWLVSIINGFAGNSNDAGLLRDVAGLLTRDLHPDGPAQARLLESLADYEAAAGLKREGVLARMDPDVALWIRRIRGLPDEQPVPTKKRGRKK